MNTESATLEWVVQGMSLDISGAGVITLEGIVKTQSGAKYVVETKQVTIDDLTVSTLLDSPVPQGMTMRQAIHGAVFSALTA